MSSINKRLRIAKGTAVQWTTWNGILANGQIGFEGDTNKVKIGNAVDDWATLPYLPWSNILQTNIDNWNLIFNNFNGSDVVIGQNADSINIGTGDHFHIINIGVVGDQINFGANPFFAGLTPDTIPYIGVGGQIFSSTVSLSKLENLLNSTSDLQDQLNTHLADTSNPHNVTKSQVGLSNVDNTSDVNKPVSTAQALADAAVLSTAQSYADSLVVGLLDDRGNFDASVNAYPSSGGSGVAGAIMKGDLWTVTVGGTLPTLIVVTPGDVVRSLVNNPGNTQGNWAVSENNFGYVAENSANKDTSGGYVGLSGWSIKFRNLANTFTSLLQNAATAIRTYTFPDKDGTVAMLDDLVAVYVTARNNTGSTILKGKVVYVTGAIGQNPTISLARANAETTSFNIGLATEDVPNNTNVQNNVTTAGLITNIDTSAFLDGDKLYLSSTTAGELQNTAPVSPNFGVFVGFVLHAHATQGKILIAPEKTIISQNTTLNNSRIVVPSNNVVDANITAAKNRANHTGTQTASTISDFNAAANAAAPAETTTTLGALIDTAGAATPNDTDNVFTALTGGGILKKITWANVRAYLNPFYIKTFTVSKVDAYSCTTTATDEVAASLLIPGGKGAIGDEFRIDALNQINSSVNNKTMKWWLSSTAGTPGSAVPGGAAQIALAGPFTTGTRGTTIQKRFAIRTLTSIIGWLDGTTSMGLDGSSANLPNTAMTVPSFANDVYLIQTVNRANSGDTIRLDYLICKIFKQ